MKCTPITPEGRGGGRGGWWRGGGEWKGLLREFRGRWWERSSTLSILCSMTSRLDPESATLVQHTRSSSACAPSERSAGLDFDSASEMVALWRTAAASDSVCCAAPRVKSLHVKD